MDVIWVRAVPLGREDFDVVLRGDPRIGPHVVRLLPGGTEIELAGGLTIGVAAEVESLLAANPYVRVIHLNSPGGRLPEGIALESVIRRHQLITYTSTQCASACTLAFLGGRKRWIGPTAVLGFHRAGPYPGESPAENERGQAALEAELRRAGVTADFVARVMATSSDDLWEPTTDELLDSGVATDLSDGSQFRISGIEDTSLESVESRLLQRPGLAALRTVDPASFRRLRAAIAAIETKGATQRDVWQRWLAELGPTASRYLPQASDEALAALATVWVDMIDASDPPVRCGDLFAGNLDRAELQAIDLDFGGRYAAAMDLVFESVAATPAAPLSADEVERQLKMLQAATGAAAAQPVSLREASGDHPALDCPLWTQLYRAALALPAARRGDALRALVSQ
jgi:hypothetical protein